MKVIFKRYLPVLEKLKGHLESEETFQKFLESEGEAEDLNVELSDLCTFSTVTSVEEDINFVDSQAILEFNEDKIAEFRKNSDYLEFELDEAHFYVVLSLLQLIFGSDEEEDEEEQEETRIEVKEEKEPEEPKPAYPIGWHNLQSLPTNAQGVTVFPIKSFDDIEPSLALNFWWPPTRSRRTDN
jgi:hypothetical protein